MPVIPAVALTSVPNNPNCAVDAFAVSEDELNAVNNAEIPVPFGSIPTFVIPLTVLVWNITRLATVALLKSPRIRLPVPVKIKLVPVTTFPLTPTPPLTTNAPVVVLVLTVPESAIILPAASIIPPVNNAPPMPAPPCTTRAPVVTLLVEVVAAATRLPPKIPTPPTARPPDPVTIVFETVELAVILFAYIFCK